jgi:hypothetical protein
MQWENFITNTVALLYLLHVKNYTRSGTVSRRVTDPDMAYTEQNLQQPETFQLPRKLFRLHSPPKKLKEPIWNPPINTVPSVRLAVGTKIRCRYFNWSSSFLRLAVPLGCVAIETGVVGDLDVRSPVYLSKFLSNLYICATLAPVFRNQASWSRAILRRIRWKPLSCGSNIPLVEEHEYSGLCKEAPW